MGMDVYGKEPANETGTYFRRTVWGWRPLADYVRGAAPEITARCRHWHSNDGDGLGKADALALAEILRHEIATGRAEAYVKIRDAELAALPLLECELCHGTGIRTDQVGVAHGSPEKVCPATLDNGTPHPRAGEKGWCNGCEGTGRIRQWDTHYPLEVEDVSEFATFLEASGGFEIC